MMRTAMLTVLLAFLALTCAQAGVVLTYKMQKGQVLRYQCESTGNGVISVTGQSGPLTTEARFQYVLTCTDVDAEGNMTIVHRVEGLEVQAQWNGRDLPVDINIPAVTMKISPGGKVLATDVARSGPAEAGSSDSLGGSLAQRTQFDVGQFFGDLKGPGFPAESVEPGARWQETVTLKTQSGQTIPVKSTTSLLDYAKLLGVTCARLQTDYSMPLDLNLLGNMALFTMSGTHSGSQIAYFDYEGGKVLRSDGIAETEMAMQTPQLFGGGGANKTMVNMNLRSNTSVVLIAE